MRYGGIHGGRMTGMFGGVRWRLVGWSILVLSLILVAISAVLYVSLNRSLMSTVDTELQTASESARTELVETGGIGDLQREVFQTGMLYLVLASDGTVVASSEGVDPKFVPPELLSSGSPKFDTVDIGGAVIRLYGQHTVERGGEPVTLIVGLSLAPEEAAAQQLVLTLLLCGATGLVLSFAGAWFLAARALVPIRSAFERQQEFVADASHELRTPLTILHSAADLLASEPERPNPEIVLEMRHEIGRMERLTRDLLTLARADRGELRLSLGRVELGALAHDLARRVAILANTADITLDVSPLGAPVTVEGDPDRLQEVGLILLDNALRHTPPGGTISIRVDQRQGAGILMVEDTGEGIPEEHLRRVFDRFHRVHPSRDRRSGGVGLGLAIAQNIVEAHGGTISVARRAAGGTCVTIRLPLLSAEDDFDDASTGDVAARR